MLIHRLPIKLKSNPEFVIMRSFGLDKNNRLERIIAWMDANPDDRITRIWEQVHKLFSERHRNFETFLLMHVQYAEKELGRKIECSGWRRLLLGAYITLEYSIEGGALFNPSIVLHPDQTGLEPGAQRFVVSLRAVGEGHISSIEFREGIIDRNKNISLNQTSKWRTTTIPESVDQLSYRLKFDAEIPLDERVLFPVTPDESNGMEDLRLVQFKDGNDMRYLGTYTAYNGKRITSKLLETKDFLDFKIHQLSGESISGKGIAIFPRKINNKFVALGRQDGESLSIMYSDDYLTWESAKHLTGPMHPFELMQIGNCGSPIETPEGWLVLTHGVGPMRRYVLSAILLDLNNPGIVMNTLHEPLMVPMSSERDGYVPNVLYTCGWLRHHNDILIPYAMSDDTCSFALVSINILLTELIT